MPAGTDSFKVSARRHLSGLKVSDFFFATAEGCCHRGISSRRPNGQPLNQADPDFTDSVFAAIPIARQYIPGCNGLFARPLSPAAELQACSNEFIHCFATTRMFVVFALKQKTFSWQVLHVIMT